MHSLPVDVLRFIATHLDFKSIVHFGCVNKLVRFACLDLFTHTSSLLSMNLASESNNILSACVFRHQASVDSIQSMEQWAKYALAINDTLLLMRVRESIERQIQLTWVPFETTHGLTTEQSNIVHCAPAPNKTVVVQAYAGTGKTNTLYHYAKMRPLCKVLYIAYNTSLASETSRRFHDMPNVHVRTMHSWALCEYDDETIMIGELSVAEVQRMIPSLSDIDALKVMYEFVKYCSSDRLDDGGARVRTLWRAMFVDKHIPVSHDAYLKAYQLRQVRQTAYDIVMVDEVQDFNDCMMSVVCCLQDTCKLFVGDVHQQIYGFKHVKRPFAYIHSQPNHLVHAFRLTKTFRFGYDLMHFTNMFMRIKFGSSGFTQCAFGNTTVCRVLPNSFNHLPTNTTILSRYHITLYETMFALSEQGKHFHIHGKRVDFDEELLAMNDLANLERPGFLTHDPILHGFGSFNEFADHVKRLHIDKWGLRINLWVRYGSAIVDHLALAKEWYSCDNGFKLITAHQSKGLEFEHVVLATDIRFDDMEAANLFYVALTRATKSVHIPTNVVNYIFSKRAHLCYTNRTSKRPKLCSRCRRRSTNQSILVECDSDVVLNNTCDIHVWEAVCSGCK